MSWTESELKFEGQWVIRLGPCFVVLLEAKTELINLCPGVVKKLEWILNQPF
jgi:hypothetical protein